MSIRPTSAALRRLAGAGAAAVGFAVLATLVRTGQRGVIEIDQAGHEQMTELADRHPLWLRAMAALTHLGDTAVVGVTVAAGVGLLLRAGRRRDAAFVAGTAVVTYAVSRFLRAGLGRPRPADRLWSADGSAFPSGHATNAAALALIAVIVGWPLLDRAGRAVLAAGAVGYAATVGVSRVAGGVHWPSDVLGAWLLAVAFVTAGAALRHQRTRSGQGSHSGA